jgi:sporulation protein YlmC with PRC-barrel domain
MGEIAGWVAPIATTIAALVTASNLGARVTGWGFVIFTVGSIGWTIYGVSTGQDNLLWQNLLLTAINLLGVWRWLGRRARFDDGAQAAAEKSERRAGETLFPVSMLGGCAVVDKDGKTVARTVDAMASCEEGRIAYLVAGTGGVAGVGETLHAIPWSKVSANVDKVKVELSAEEFAALEPIPADNWPSRVR